MSVEFIPGNLILEGNLSKNYNAFINSFNRFLNSLDGALDFTEQHKIKIFLSVIGKEGCKVHKTFNLSLDDPSVTLQMVQDRFKRYCESFKDNVLYYSYKFFNRKQFENESFNDYFIDICELADLCDFNINDKERLIRDKVVAGLYNSDSLNEIFGRGLMKLDDIVELCRSGQAINNNVVKTEKEDSICNEVEAEDNATYSCVSVETPVNETLNGERYELEKGEVVMSECFTDQRESHDGNFQMPNGLIKEKEPKLETENDSPEEETYNDEEVQIAESENSQKDETVEIITIDSSESSEEMEQSNEENEENNAPSHVRAKKRRLVQYRQTSLNFPKIKGLKNLSQDKKFSQSHLCDKRFKFVLKEHHEVTLNVKPFKCSLCKGNFSSKRTLSTHLRNVHRVVDSDVKNKILELDIKNEIFQCLKCPKKYVHKKSLKRHMLEKHKEEDSDSESKVEPKKEESSETDDE